MGSRHRPRPFGSLGWSLAGGLALSLSFPPVGFYPLAWVALVPLLSRWVGRKASLALAREIYAVFLVASAATGFWALHLPNELQSALAGLGLLLVPLPITAAFWGAAWVRERFGLKLGLTALLVDVLAAEFLTLHLPFGTPWSVLGHTQALALPFIQAVEIGGVLMLSAWVLALNIAAFMAIEASRAPAPRRWADRGVAVAAFSAIVVVAALYSTVRTAGDDVPPGHIRIGIVQPDIAADRWEDPQDEKRVLHLARVSDALLADWATEETAASRSNFAATPRPDLLIWPRNSLPVYGDVERERELYQRLSTWSTRRRTPLLTGARTAINDEGRTDKAAQFFPLPMSRSQQSALLFVPSQDGATRYDQSRRIPILEAVPSAIARSVGDAVPAFKLGSRRTLLPAGRTHLAASLGYESVFGDHTRRFVDDGANLLVAMSPATGGLAGRRQHLAFLRLRALETGRAIVVAAPSGGSALVLPDGRATHLVSTNVPEGTRVEAPIYSGKTLYVMYGDWLGQLALLIGIIGHATFAYINRVRPKKAPRSRSMARMRRVPG
ncbi:apolipoprotein N-acyltransferase [Rubricoccus marinus]|uniref:Apolipoprotein N-acyltransferase n=1 Tax=Rubricoccus marinus TaxID=716817 RepID=A0A259TZL3_9BACT|nr:apolipoprotein N-acyltransferase [Rubricoccus marinus]OZC03192.1 apolipoprotein N-acyltransferase [Rubricoccus marinus]